MSSENLHLPQRLWSKIPEESIQWDLNLQQKLKAQMTTHPELWKSLENFSENEMGMAFLACIVLGVIVFIRKKHHKAAPFSKKNLLFYSCVLVGVGINDFVSNQLKHLFGRAKPFVKSIELDKIPPLSFPSNHASNISFLFVLLFILLIWRHKNAISRGTQWSFGLIGGATVLLIASSRIFFGEHYPLDVLFGIFVGSLSAFLYSKACQAFVL